MSKTHHGLTVAVSVKEDVTAELQTVLKRLNNAGCESGRIFKRSKTTITVSGTILPKEPAFDLPETFVFATSYWGSKDCHIRDLIKTNKIALRLIFKHCVGFPARMFLDDQSLYEYLNKFSHFSAFTSRYTCITNQEVEEEERLRFEIVNYIKTAQRAKVFDRLSAIQIRVLIIRHLKAQGTDFEWAFKPIRFSLKERFHLFRNKQSPKVVAGLGILTYWSFAFLVLKFLNSDWHIVKHLWVSSFIVAASVGSIVLMMRQIGRAKHKPVESPDFAHCRKVAATQLCPIINEMTASSPLKSGVLRRNFYKTALMIIDKLYRPQVPTVRTIRWLTVNKNRRLLFFSNYANTTDFYVRDFLNGATPFAVNFMFTNGCDFPDAPFLFMKGIKDDPEGYMNAVRKRQLVTVLSYVHCPDLTVDIIQKNRKIRKGLVGKRNEVEAIKWLQLF